jgi:hypothetical protein
MVDVTFPFIILFGGLLVGIVTARVRRHTGRRKAADILPAAICGPLAMNAWVKLVVPHLVARAPGDPPLSREWGSALADLLWFSPVIGGFIGVAAVAIGFRIAGQGLVRPQESWGEKIGDGLRIIGWVYAVISAALIVGIVILAVSFQNTGVLTPVLLVDLLTGPVVILMGWLVTRFFRTPDVQPAAPLPT